MNHISPLTNEVVNTGQSFDINESVFTTKTITPYELAHKYNKSVTALVNGSYVGWGFAPDFIRFKSKAENYDNQISEIVFWHNSAFGKFCRHHAMMLVAFGGDSVIKFDSGRMSPEDNALYFTQIRGRNLPKSKIQTITFKTIYDKSGEIIKDKSNAIT